MSTLDGLDRIAWDQLTHAYGPAADVPAQIRALESGDAEQRDAAFGELFANIWHQGTVYEATIFALPFLIELLRVNAVPEPAREHLALLVACILSGRGYSEVHHTITLMNPFTRKPIPKPADLHERIARERLIVAEIRKRGVDALELLIPYLAHAHHDIRQSVAEAFANYPGQAEILVPALRAALAIEDDREVRVALQRSVDALTKIGKPAG